MRKPILVVVSIVALVIGLAVVVVRAAAHEGVNPNEPNVIHACIDKRQGSVRIVTDPRNCRGNEYARHWNTQHPILVLPGSNVVDLSELGCNSQIHFARDFEDSAIIRWHCEQGRFFIEIVDGQGTPPIDVLSLINGVLDLSGMTQDATIQLTGGVTLFEQNDNELTVSIAGDETIGMVNDTSGGYHELSFNPPGLEGRIRVEEATGQMELFASGGYVFHNNGRTALAVSDGLIDLRGMSRDPAILMPRGAMTIIGHEFTVLGDERLLLDINQHSDPNGAEFYVMSLVEDERGLAAMEYRTDLNAFGWTVPIDGQGQEVSRVQNGLIEMYPSTTNERSIGFAYPQAELGPARLFYNVEQEAYHFTAPDAELLKIEEGLLKAENSDIMGRIYRQDTVPDIATGSFAFWIDESDNDRVYLVLDVDDFEYVTEMGPPP